MSSVDEDKFQAVAQSFRGQPTIISGGIGSVMSNMGPGVVETSGGPNSAEESVDSGPEATDTGSAQSGTGSGTTGAVPGAASAGEGQTEDGSVSTVQIDDATAGALAGLLAGREELTGMENSFKTYVAEHYYFEAGSIQIEMVEDYLLIPFGDGMLVDSGSASIKPSAMDARTFIADER
jgi:hypothetical protein